MKIYQSPFLFLLLTPGLLQSCSKFQIRSTALRFSQPAVSMVSDSYVVSEAGGQITVSAKLDAAFATQIAIPFHLTGTATSGVDYLVGASAFTFLPGTTQASVTFSILQDNLVEPTETIQIELTPPTGITVGSNPSATLQILDDDVVTTLSTLSFATAAQTVLESVGNVSVQLTLSSALSQAITIPLSISGSASTSDHTLGIREVTIPAGAVSASIPFSIVNDALAESDETLILTLTAPASTTLGAIPIHTLTIQDNDTPPSVQFSSSSQSVSESVGAVTLQVNLSTPFSSSVVVPYTVSGTATVGADHDLASGSLTIPAGQQAGAIVFNVINDALNESDETVIATLGTPTNASLGSKSTHTVTLVDNDAMPTIQFAASSQSVQENIGSLNLAVNLSAPSGRSVQVSYVVSGTSSYPSDHNLVSGSMIFNAGQTSQNIPVSIVNDMVTEPAETLIVTLTSPVNAQMGINNIDTVTLMDVASTTPVAQFSTATQSVSEGVASATVTVNLSQASANPVTIPFSTSGTATVTLDYTVSASSIVIPAGSTSGTLTVNPVNDTLDENDEILILTLGTPTGATLGAIQTQTLTILDNDNPPTLKWQLASQSIAENGGTATITASLSAASALPISATYTFGGTALRGTDYTAAAPTGTLTIPAGSSTAAVSIPVINNSTYQGSRTASLTLSAPVNATLGTPITHTLTITDDESQPQVRFGSTSQSVLESIGNSGSIPITLSNASSLAITVPYTVSGTATAPADHNLVSGSLTIPAGTTSSSIPFTVIDDTISEPSETIIVTLGAPTNAILGTPTQHTVSITDNDVLIPVVVFGSSSQVVAENVGTVSISVNLSGATTSAISIPFTVAGTASAPSDHSLANGTLSIPAGAASGNISFNVVDDSIDENDETVIVTLGAPTGATLGSTIVHTVTLTDNDSPPGISFNSASQLVSETVGSVTVSATLASISALSVSVPYTVSGTASNPSDHNAASGTLTIPAGQMSAQISFNVVSDSISEGSETVIFSMGAPTNAVLGANSIHTVTISDTAPTSIQLSWASQIQSANEGSTITLQANLSAPSTSTITAPITLSGTAISGSDYILSPSTLSIPAGTTRGSVSLTLVQDNVSEPTETATLALSTPSGGATLAPGQNAFTLNLFDQTSMPSISFTQSELQVSESVGTIALTVALSAPSSLPITVPYFQSSDTNNNIFPPGTLSFAPGVTTAILNFTVPNDTILNPNFFSTTTLTLGVPTNAIQGGIVTCRIRAGDDETVVIRFTQKQRSVVESAGTITIQADLDRPLPGTDPAQIGIGVSGGVIRGASPGVDFSFPSPVFTFQPGSTSATTTLTMIDDSEVEPLEAIGLSLSPNTPFSRFSTETTQVISILDNDSTGLTVEWAPTGEIQGSSSSVGSASNAFIAAGEKSGTLSYAVTLSKPSASPITVPITILNGSATPGVDFVLNTPNLTIPAGSTSAVATVSVIDDTTYRGGRTIKLGLGTPTGVTVTTSGIAVLVIDIVDDELQPTLQFQNPEITFAESAGAITIPASLSSLSAASLVAQGQFRDSKPAYPMMLALPGDDFTVSSDPMRANFAAGVISSSFPATLVNDTLSEDTEYFYLRVVNLYSGADIREQSPTPTEIVKITDDDPSPSVQWTLASQTINESSGKAVVTASLSAIAGKNVHIPFTVGGSASFGLDHGLKDQEVIIPMGSTSGTVEVPMVVDSTSEPDETITLTLQTGGNAPLGSLLTHTITVHDLTSITPNLTAFQNSVYALVRASSCVSCHIPGGIAAFAPFASPDVTEAFNAAVPRANFADIPSSLFVTKLAANHQGQLAVTNPMITAITQWRDGSMAASSPTPTPAPGALTGGSVGLQDFYQFDAGLMSAIQGKAATSYFTYTYETSKTNLSPAGNPTDISPPMVDAYLSVSAEYCRVLVYEVAGSATNKRGFDQISGLNNFILGNNNFTSSLQDSVSQKFALMFWQRAATTAELQTIRTLVTGLIADNPNIQTRDLGAAMCTAISGSVEGIDN